MKWDNAKNKSKYKIGVSISQIEQAKYISYIRSEEYQKNQYQKSNYKLQVKKHILYNPKIKFPERIKSIYEVSNTVVIEKEISYSENLDSHIKNIYEINKKYINNSIYKIGSILFFDNIGYCVIIGISGDYYKLKTTVRDCLATFNGDKCIIKHKNKNICLRYARISSRNIKVEQIYLKNKTLYIECELFFARIQKKYKRNSYSININKIPNIRNMNFLDVGDIIKYNTSKNNLFYGVVVLKRFNVVHVHTICGLQELVIYKNNGIYQFEIKKDISIL